MARSIAWKSGSRLPYLQHNQTTGVVVDSGVVHGNVLPRDAGETGRRRNACAIDTRPSGECVCTGVFTPRRLNQQGWGSDVCLQRLPRPAQDNIRHRRPFHARLKPPAASDDACRLRPGRGSAREGSAMAGGGEGGPEAGGMLRCLL